MPASLGQMPHSLFPFWLDECLPVASRKGYCSQLCKVCWGLRPRRTCRGSGVFPVPSPHGPCLELCPKSYHLSSAPLTALSSKENAKRICMLLCCDSAFVSCLLGASGLHMPSGQDIFLLGLISHTASARQRWCPARLGGVGDLHPEQCMVGWQL